MSFAIVRNFKSPAQEFYVPRLHMHTPTFVGGSTVGMITLRKLSSLTTRDYSAIQVTLLPNFENGLLDIVLRSGNEMSLKVKHSEPSYKY